MPRHPEESLLQTRKALCQRLNRARIARDEAAELLAVASPRMAEQRERELREAQGVLTDRQRDLDRFDLAQKAAAA